jgi:hypothetical protein
MKPSLLYYFENIFLRDAIYKHWEAFHSDITKGPDILKDGLVSNFLRVQSDPKEILSKKKVEINNDDFNPTMAAVGSLKIPFLVINFPEPKETAEAYYGGIILSESPKYYLLELHRPDDIEKKTLPKENQKESYFLGVWDNSFTHVNLGDLKTNSIGEFISRVDEIA